MVVKATSRSLTDVLFDNARDGLCLVAPDGTVIRANADWLRSTGFTEEQVVGENIVDLFPETRDMALAMHARARAGHRVEVPRHAQVVNGREAWWEGSIEPVAMEGGTGLLITARELKGDTEWEPSNAPAVVTDVYERLFRHSIDGVLLATPDGEILRANAVACATLGRTEEEIRAAGRRGIVVPTDTVAKLLAERERTGLAQGEVMLRRRDGSTLLVALTSAILPVGGGARYSFIVFRDLTEREQEEARRRTAELHAVLDAVPAAVFITRDRDSRVMEANRFCTEMLRVPSGANVSMSAAEPVRPRKFRAMRDGVEIAPPDLAVQIAAARGEEVRGYEFDLVFDDGEVRHMMGNATPLRDPHGTPTGAVGAFLDITNRKHAEDALRESEERFRLLTEAMPQIVCMLAPDGTVEYVNTTWIRFSGLDAAATARAGWRGIVHPSDVEAALDCRRRALKQLAPQDVELRYRAADGTYRWFLSRLAPVVESGRAIRFIGAALEIESRKRVEMALRDADRRKDEFLGMLSHELRNPLAPIRNSTYILQHAAPGSEQARRAQAVIERQAEHLTRLVDDLLDVTRIARGKIELRRERIDLREVVRRAADDYWLILSERGVEFRTELPDVEAWANADATRITQIVSNLLHNASKFTHSGGAVVVSLRADGAEAEIRVRDTGAGIDPAALPHLFDAFFQSEQTLARAEGGLGLGLALVKGLVELHGGSVHVESPGKGKGTQFIVRLPLAVRVEEPRQDVRLRRRGSPRRIVVVDDNRDSADSLADILRLLGHTVDVAYDGASAIEKVRASPPDVVLCDIGLPGMSGYDVARTLRASVLEGVQLIAVSGYAQPEDVKRAIDAGFDGHVAKPCDPEKIERLLD